MSRSFCCCVIGWRGEWSFEKYLFVTNEQFAAQADLIAHSNMTLRFACEEAVKPDQMDTSGEFLAFTNESDRAEKCS